MCFITSNDIVYFNVFFIEFFFIRYMYHDLKSDAVERHSMGSDVLHYIC